jgi:hypothetical protein
MFLLFPPMTRVFDSLYGRVLLASAQSADQWDAGNRIHQANIMMGRAALRGGNIEEAKAHLLAAGRTSGSPQLNSFGPDMSLAGEMLETGQRETVLEYLGLCRSLWKLGGGSLDAWTLDIQEGRTPNFGWSPGRTVATVTDTLPDPNAQVLQVATVRDDATRKEIRIVAAVDTRPDGQGRLKSHATHLKFDADLPLKDDRFRGSGRPRLPTMANRWLGINEHRLKVDTIPLGNVTGSAKTMEFRLAGDGQENFGFVRLSYLSGEMSGPSTVSISALAQAEGKEFQDGQSGIRVVIAAENLAKISAHWWAPGSRPVLADLENFTRSARGTNPTTSPPTTKTGPGP